MTASTPINRRHADRAHGSREAGRSTEATSPSREQPGNAATSPARRATNAGPLDSLTHLARAAGGRWLRPPANPDEPVAGIGIDTRQLQPGKVFVAIRGDRFDGHDFLSDAARAGASALVVSDTSKAEPLTTIAPDEDGPAVLLVQDTVAALHDLARAHRRRLRAAGTRVIAVTGSNGKTTTRHLIHTLLSSRLRGTQSPRSFNNHIGVPLTLLAASPDDDFVVAEIGTNHPGEIAPLAAIARPDVAVVTNIGTAHIGNFASQRAIADEKAVLLSFIEPGGIVVLPDPLSRTIEGGDLIDPHAQAVAENATVIHYGDRTNTQELESHGEPRGEVLMIDCTPASNGGCRITARLRDPAGGGAPDTMARRGNKPAASSQGRQPVGDGPETDPDRHPDATLTVTVPLPGRHNASNTLAAIAVARSFGLEGREIVAALEGAKGVAMRFEVVPIRGGHRGNLTIINDAYNANPDSVAAALRALATWPLPAPDGRRVAILGDMLELGKEEAEAHRGVGRLLAELAPEPSNPTSTSRAPSPPDQPVIHTAILLGRRAMFAAESLARSWSPHRIHAFPDWDHRSPMEVARLLAPGDVALIKASRSMRLERLVPAIEATFGSAVPNHEPRH